MDELTECMNDTRLTNARSVLMIDYTHQHAALDANSHGFMVHNFNGKVDFYSKRDYKCVETVQTGLPGRMTCSKINDDYFVACSRYRSMFLSLVNLKDATVKKETFVNAEITALHPAYQDYIVLGGINKGNGSGVIHFYKDEDALSTFDMGKRKITDIVSISEYGVRCEVAASMNDGSLMFIDANMSNMRDMLSIKLQCGITCIAGHPSGSVLAGTDNGTIFKFEKRCKGHAYKLYTSKPIAAIAQSLPYIYATDATDYVQVFDVRMDRVVEALADDLGIPRDVDDTRCIRACDDRVISKIRGGVGMFKVD